MNKLINFTLKNKFALWLMTIIIAAAGLYAGLNMKMETIPNINTPVVTVTTPYPGSTPEEVTDKVTKPIEKSVQNLNGVDIVSSSSYQNTSSVQIQYHFDKKMDKAEEEVTEAVSKVSFPTNVQDPEVSRLSMNSLPVITLSVTGENQSLEQLTNKVEDDIAPSFEGLQGVSSVKVAGQQANEVQLTFDQDKMASLGLQKDTIKQLIKGSDVKVPLGLYTFDDTKKSIVVDGNITTLKDLRQLQIPVTPSSEPSTQSQGIPQKQNDSGSQVQESRNQGAAQKTANIPTVELQEIANIKMVGKAESISRTNGKKSISIQVVKTADANTVDVVNRVKEQMNDLEKDIDGINMISSFDQGEPIENSVNTMLSKAIFGALFAMIIIFMFLRNVKTTLISVVSIPLSLLMALLLLNQMDITLNIMTLGAMTIAIGRVVDDSIVVIENIYRRMALEGEQLKGRALIREATKEMFRPIASSTIVTIAVFLPMGLVSGMVGQLFMPFALTVVLALLSSLLVAVTVVPVLAHSFMKQGPPSKKETTTHNEGPGRMARGYKRILNWTLNHKIITSGLAVLLLIGSLALVPAIGVSFLPSQEQKMMIATYKPEPGQTLDSVKKRAADAETYLEDRENVQTIQYSLGGENPMNPGASNQAMFFVQYEDDTENFNEEKEQVIKDLKSQTNKGEWASQNFTSTGGSNQIQLLVKGDSMDAIKPVVQDIEKVMQDQDNLKDVGSSMSETYDEYTLVANQKKLSELGLTAGQISQSLNQTQQRPMLTTIQKDGESVNVYLQVNEKNYSNINDVKNTDIQTPVGKTVKVEDVTDVNKGETSDTITRRNGSTYVSVSGKLTTDNATAVSQSLQNDIDEMDLPSGIEVSMGGVTQDIQESFTQLGLAMLAAIAIVYLVLVITFGGALAPFAILFSLPFTIIGALIGLLISGEPLGVSAMIGALMLIGIVVTNAIVLIDRVIHKEQEGWSIREALLEAGTIRLRPILMTALATIGALLPLALGLEGSGFIGKSLGITVIGGLTSSTLLTLVIVPIIYDALSKLRRKNKNRDREA
ncbi:efflux RND transporter permease subunit [Tuberibacillus sp. Marseille-P3662]|uniref:efflux RND transporter permease subunit n=1 Tax=Tuberibacillus sp. Marseille-P3662 TaxID=1965358 RepID=UPI000A1CBE2D|nr:efflux RND transporter permease subunit [Tuberibacillus sp. Marseille-P3662]